MFALSHLVAPPFRVRTDLVWCQDYQKRQIRQNPSAALYKQKTGLKFFDIYLKVFFIDFLNRRLQIKQQSAGIHIFDLCSF